MRRSLTLLCACVLSFVISAGIATAAMRTSPPTAGMNDQITGGKQPLQPFQGAPGGDGQRSLTQVWVDDDYNSGTPNWGIDHFALIQDGINAVDIGGTVIVAAGTYHENIIVGKSVTVSGAGAGVVTIYPAVSGTGGDGGPSFSDSQVIVVQANDVTIDGVTVDGDNPGLISGIVRNGADIDARNGIIEADGPWNNLVVRYCVVKNIYLRGIYARSGGSGFNIHHNTVTNVAGGNSSIAIFNFGGSGIFESNTVSYTNDAISANWSRGTQFLNNVITHSGSGVHTDNSGGAADLIQGNDVSLGGTNSYGIWVFFPYVNPTVTNNTVSGQDIGLFAWGGAGGAATFSNNTVDGTGKPNAIGIYVTCGPDYWGSYQSSVTANFSDNSVSHAAYGWFVETDEAAPFFSTTVSASNTTMSSVVTEVATFGLGTFSVAGVSGNTVEVDNPGKIQIGIDMASSGGVVHVLPGLYDERVLVNKACTVSGATAGISKKGFVVPPAYAYDTSVQTVVRPSTDADAAVMQVNADNVILDGLVVANEVCATGSVYRDLVGVGQSLAAPIGVQVLNCVLGPNTNTASQDGTMGRCGVAVYGPHTLAVKLIVRGNKIFDSKGNGGGIMIVGPYGQTYHGGTLYAGLFSGSIIEGNEITGNHRSGIELAGGVQGGIASVDHFIIRNNLITNNGWFSLADKDNLKYGHGIMFIRGGGDKDNADAAGSQYIDLSGNVITGNEKSGAYIGPKNKDLIWQNNFVQGNGLGTGGYSLWDGVRVDLDESYYPINTHVYGYLTNVLFTSGTISGNGSMGYRVMQTPTLGPVTATPVWWGNATGPYHTTLNPAGLGNAVSDNILFDPWIGKAGGENVVCAPDPLEISTSDSDQNDRTTVHYVGGGGGALYGFSIDVKWDAAVAGYVGITKPATGPFASATLFQVVNVDDPGYVHKRVDAALGGSNPGTAGPADLFVVTMHGLGCSTGSPVDLTLNYMRDNANHGLSGFYADDGEVKVDLGAPTVTAAAIARTNLPNTGYVKDGDAISLTTTVADACDSLTAENVKADLTQFGGGASVAPTSYVGTLATWDFTPIAATPANGTITATITATDALGNVGTGSASVIADNTPPAATVSNFQARPGHNKVQMTWTNPSGDPNLDAYGLMIRRADWGDPDYPLYSGTAVTCPGVSEGVLAHEQVGLATNWTEAFLSTGMDRDIYAYQAFVFDAAYNYSLPSAGAQGMATNYWLGDVAPIVGTDVWTYTSIGDGRVNTDDISALGGTYYVQSGPYWNPHCDVGPTSNGSPTGIPHPDGRVDFEDLMIFALNYGTVAPLMGQQPTMVALGDEGHGAVSIALGPIPTDVRAGQTLSVPVILRGQTAGVQGISVVLGFDAAQLHYESSTVSQAIGQTPNFFKDMSSTGKLGLDLALLGQGIGFTGEGVVFTARFRVVTDGPAGMTLTETRVRDTQNRNLLAQPDVATNPVVESEATVSLPTVRRLGDPRPNPFNPKTEIAFDLPQSAPVQIAIYNVAGRVVRTLVSGMQSAGSHVAEWDGRDDGGRLVGSGIYFCVMNAEGFHAQKRLTLLK